MRPLLSSSADQQSKRPSLEFCESRPTQKKYTFQKDSLVILPALTSKQSHLTKLKQCYVHIICIGNQVIHEKQQGSSQAEGKKRFMEAYATWIDTHFDARCFILCLDVTDSKHSVDLFSMLPEKRRKFSLLGTIGFTASLCHVSRKKISSGETESCFEVNLSSYGAVVVERVPREKAYLLTYLSFLEEIKRTKMTHFSYKNNVRTENWLYSSVLFKSLNALLLLWDRDDWTHKQSNDGAASRMMSVKASPSLYAALKGDKKLRLLAASLLDEGCRLSLKGEDISFLSTAASPFGLTGVSFHWVIVLLRLPSSLFSPMLDLCLLMSGFSSSSTLAEGTRCNHENEDEVQEAQMLSRVEDCLSLTDIIIETATKHDSPVPFVCFLHEKLLKLKKSNEDSEVIAENVNEEKKGDAECSTELRFTDFITTTEVSYSTSYLVLAALPLVVLGACAFYAHMIYVLFYT